MAKKSGKKGESPASENLGDENDILFGGAVLDKDEPDEARDEAERKEKAKKRQKKLIYAGVSFILIVILLLVYLAFFKKDKIEEAKVPDIKPVSLQLINRQQVEWANSICSISSFWAPKMKNKVVNSGVVSPVAGRNAAVKVLTANSKVARQMNDQIKALPEKNFETSKKEHQIPSVMLIERVDGDTPDEKVSKNTETVNIAIDTYANSMDNIVKGLKDVAAYDDLGLRASLNDSFTAFVRASSDMEKKFSEALKASDFDNTATVNAIAGLPFCGEKFVSEENKKELASDIDKQNKIINFVKLDRCRQFIDRNKVITEETATAPSVSAEPTTKTPAGKPAGKPATTAPVKPKPAKSNTPEDIRKAAVDKAIISVYEQDLSDCTTFIASPGVDVNDPLFKNGVDSDTNNMVTPQIPGEIAEKLKAAGKKVDDKETSAYNEPAKTTTPAKPSVPAKPAVPAPAPGN